MSSFLMASVPVAGGAEMVKAVIPARENRCRSIIQSNYAHSFQ